MTFRTTLMHPPLDDPTMPYHANAYLAGHLRHKGFTDVAIRDINIEYVNHCLEGGAIKKFYAEADRRFAALGQCAALSYPEQEQYYRLAAAPRHTPEALAADVALFRSRDHFLDYGAYTAAMKRINGYFGLLGTLSYPGEIDNFMLRSRGRYSPYSLADLLSADLAEKLCYPFIRYFEDKLRHDPEIVQTDLFGISVVYDHQLVHSLHLARMIKRIWPEKKVVFGGTAISQLYKYLRNKQKIKLFFKLCDALVIGEGESALCEIIAARGEFSAGTRVTNTITYDPNRDDVNLPDVRYEDVSRLGAPVYDYKWDLYLSPERGINYSPTRGCYWNKCTFCDYGLNIDKPTSPWRERTIEQVISDLQAAKTEYGVRFLYLAVDVMSPSYMSRLAEAIVESGLEVRWSSEIRLEKAFKPDRVQKIAQSGAVCLSFGMESGNQRILDLIDKGTKLEYMSEAMKNFANAGVAVQLMAFTGFPTETAEEASETRQFVRDNEDYWSAGGLGTFLLTGTSIIARNPEQFGITVIETKDADIARAITYSMNGEDERKSNLAEDADASFDDADSVFPHVLGRPWAGGTDTLHSMIYYEEFGRNCFKERTPEYIAGLACRVEEEQLQCEIVLAGRLSVSRINLLRVFENRAQFVAYLKQRLEAPAEPTYDSFLEWSRGIPGVSPEAEETHWLLTLNAAVQLSQVVFKLLDVAVTRKLRLRELLSGFQPAVRARLLEHFSDMEKQGLLALVRPGQALPETRHASDLHDLTRRVDARVAPSAQAPARKLGIAVT